MLSKNQETKWWQYNVVGPPLCIGDMLRTPKFKDKVDTKQMLNGLKRLKTKWGRSMTYVHKKRVHNVAHLYLIKWVNTPT